MKSMEQYSHLIARVKIKCTWSQDQSKYSKYREPEQNTWSNLKALVLQQHGEAKLKGKQVDL